MGTSSSDARSATHFLSCAWPYLTFGALALVYSYFFFFRKTDQWVLAYLQFLVNLIVGLAVVVYVIYTRDLAESSQRTAEANRQLVETMRSLVIEEWVAQERPSEKIDLARGGEELSRALHVDDMGMSGNMYGQRCQDQKRRVLIFRPFNAGPRPILLRKIKLEVMHARGRGREISCDPERPIRIPQYESVEIQLVYDFAGQIDARILEIEYLDGDNARSIWVANPWQERRYFAPETAGTPG